VTHPEATGIANKFEILLQDFRDTLRDKIERKTEQQSGKNCHKLAKIVDRWWISWRECSINVL
jgi:hypothetical protein